MLIINYRKTSKASYKKNEQNLSSNNCKTLFSDNNIDVLTYGINKYSSYYKNEVFFLLIDGYCFYKNRLLGCEDLYEQYLKNGFDFVKHSKGSFNIILYLVQSKSLIIKTDKYGPVGIAIKVLDGNFRALPIATIKLLDHLDILNDKEKDQLSCYGLRILKNHNNLEIGRIEAYIDF